MNKYRSIIMLLLISAVFIAPLKLPSCPKQPVVTPTLLSIAVTPCSSQQLVSSSCFSTSYWLQDELSTRLQIILQSLIGLLSFLLIFSKYSSPRDEIYRPPIWF